MPPKLEFWPGEHSENCDSLSSPSKMMLCQWQPVAAAPAEPSSSVIFVVIFAVYFELFFFLPFALYGVPGKPQFPLQCFSQRFLRHPSRRSQHGVRATILPALFTRGISWWPWGRRLSLPERSCPIPAVVRKWCCGCRVGAKVRMKKRRFTPCIPAVIVGNVRLASDLLYVHWSCARTILLLLQINSSTGINKVVSISVSISISISISISLYLFITPLTGLIFNMSSHWWTQVYYQRSVQYYLLVSSSITEFACLLKLYLCLIMWSPSVDLFSEWTALIKNIPLCVCILNPPECVPDKVEWLPSLKPWYFDVSRRPCERQMMQCPLRCPFSWTNHEVPFIVFFQRTKCETILSMVPFQLDKTQ